MRFGLSPGVWRPEVVERKEKRGACEIRILTRKAKVRKVCQIAKLNRESELPDFR